MPCVSQALSELGEGRPPNAPDWIEGIGGQGEGLLPLLHEIAGRIISGVSYKRVVRLYDWGRCLEFHPSMPL